jgi:hypothetical protein
MRNLLFLILFCCSYFSFAQEVTISMDCYDSFKFEYNFLKEFNKTPKETTIFIAAKNNLDILSQPTLQIEVQPMNDCMSDLNGELYGETIKIKLNKENKYFEVKFTNIKRKCFKWRLISTSTNCIAKSDWNFVIFSL